MSQTNIERMINTPTYGVELEKAFATTDGDPYLVDNAYFEAVCQANIERGDAAQLKCIGDTVVGVATEFGVEGLDNSFGLGESSTGPITEAAGGLNRLNEIIGRQLGDVDHALATADATVINMSNHPLTMLTPEVYGNHVVPKPVYGYMRSVRGWNHVAGINAKAQNSPSVGIDAERAVEALNCTLGFGPALIALYANSPFDQGKLADQKESRLNIWNDVFANAAFSGDKRLHQMPEVPFENMREYFKWMFKDDTAMYFIVVGDDGKPPKSEKGNVRLLSVDGHPPLLDFLKQDSWQASEFGSGAKSRVAPHMGHFAMHQFTQFAGARIRYGLNDDGSSFEVGDFNDAMAASGQEVDTLFAKEGAFFYIEGRDPGANFPDAQLKDIGNTLSDSVTISPAALHTGFIRNLDASRRVLEKYGWDNLRGLRQEAIKLGMAAVYNGIEVSQLCDDMLATAAQGLHSDEQWMLTYPEHVLRTSESGADRALSRYDELAGNPAERIRQIVRERAYLA